MGLKRNRTIPVMQSSHDTPLLPLPITEANDKQAVVESSGHGAGYSPQWERKLFRAQELDKATNATAWLVTTPTRSLTLSDPVWQQSHVDKNRSERSWLGIHAEARRLSKKRRSY